MRVLIAVHTLIQRHGYSPTYREIAAEAGIRSSGDAHHRVKALEYDGCLSSRDGSARTLRLTPRGKGMLRRHGLVTCPRCGGVLGSEGARPDTTTTGPHIPTEGASR